MKKGFTLIELLAVIIILAVIALIATPVVLNVIENSKKEAFKDSVYGAIDAAKYYYYENPNTVQLSVTDLKLQGKQFKSGIINLKEGMFEAVNVTDGEYCGNTIDSKVVVVKGNCGIELGNGSITVALKESGINYLKVEVVNADFEDSFYSYEYKLTNSEGLTIQNWTESRENSYTFKDLKEDTEYIVQAKLKTEKLLKPTIKADTTNYAKNKVITIEYPVYQDYNFEYYYSLDGENYIKVSDSKIDIEITNNTTIYARVKDENNNYDTTYEETKIDNEAPVITNTPSDITITEGESYNLNDISVSDNSEIYTITKTINNTSTLKHGTYLVGYKVTDEAGNSVNIVRNLKVQMPADTSGASTPNISSGMIPVVYDYGKEAFVKADTNSNWYNYNNKEWANMVLVSDAVRDKYNSALEGTQILETDVLAYYVWIPRYRYQIFYDVVNATSKQLINIKFESKETSKSLGTAKAEWLTHPAFTFGSDELDGIWVGKFEITGSTTTPTIKPNQTSLRNLNVSSLFNVSKKINYGTIRDTSMIKNIEWGAIAYLTTSIYGQGLTEVRINNSSTYITGCAASIENGSAYNGCENIYNTPVGVLASTTGNISGIYDMSGGSYEYVMGVMEDSLGSNIPVSGYSTQYNSGFIGKNLNDKTVTTGVAFPESRYYDIYKYGTSYSDYTRYHMGDAITETKGWYGDSNTYFVSPSGPWLVRGDYYGHDSNAGVFAFYNNYGRDRINYSARAVLR